MSVIFMEVYSDVKLVCFNSEHLWCSGRQTLSKWFLISEVAAVNVFAFKHGNLHILLAFIYWAFLGNVGLQKC